MITPPASNTTFRHDLRLPGQPILPYTDTPGAVHQNPLISQRVHELKQLIGENEDKTDRNIRGLEEIALKWNRAGSNTLDEIQASLSSIQQEVEDIHRKLKAKRSAANNPVANYRRRSNITQRSPQRNSIYLNDTLSRVPTDDIERDKTLDLTYAALTAGEESFERLAIAPKDPMAPLQRSFDRALPRMSPTVRNRVDDIIGSMGEVARVATPANNEVVAELMTSVNGVIDAFSL